MPSILNTHMKPGTSRMAEYCDLRTALLNSSARPWSFLLELAIPPSLHYHTLTYLNVHSYTAQTTPTRITPRTSRVRIPLKLQASWFPRQLALATSESLDLGGRFSNFLSAPADFVWTSLAVVSGLHWSICSYFLQLLSPCRNIILGDQALSVHAKTGMNRVLWCIPYSGGLPSIDSYWLSPCRNII